MAVNIGADFEGTLQLPCSVANAAVVCFYAVAMEPAEVDWLPLEVEFWSSASLPRIVAPEPFAAVPVPPREPVTVLTLEQVELTSWPLLHLYSPDGPLNLTVTLRDEGSETSGPPLKTTSYQLRLDHRPTVIPYLNPQGLLLPCFVAMLLESEEAIAKGSSSLRSCSFFMIFLLSPLPFLSLLPPPSSFSFLSPFHPFNFLLSSPSCLGTRLVAQLQVCCSEPVIVHVAWSALAG
ncbi:MAG: hypothetical protein KIT54_11770, partial [Phycisphaeraceae bacterium]|nr:hypothetical protein [Phycisphaeraceae bacterium]